MNTPNDLFPAFTEADLTTAYEQASRNLDADILHAIESRKPLPENLRDNQHAQRARELWGQLQHIKGVVL